MSGFRLLLSKGEFFMAKIDWGEKLELKISGGRYVFNVTGTERGGSI